jgi:hypothetical protein
MSTSLCISTEPILFTRYLYNKTEVKQSLFISLLNRNLDEAMFWAYELYFSGFDTDVFDYIINVYREAYSVLNPKLVLFFEQMVITWSKDKSSHWTIGSIITTLIYRDYDINSFVTTYFNVNCKPNKVNINSKRKMVITLTNEDIEKYKTITSGRAFNVLQRACKYAVHKEYNQLFGAVVPKLNDLQNIYYYHWQYYCLDTPVWRNRIFKYNGQINHEKKTIIFDDEDSLQGFYDHWGYYPDEQPMFVDDKTIGNTFPKKNISIMEFCNKFNANPTVKKIKTNNIHHEKTNTENANITNSIEYT